MFVLLEELLQFHFAYPSHMMHELNDPSDINAPLSTYAPVQTSPLLPTCQSLQRCIRLAVPCFSGGAER